jgi:AraC-like DNA-binding protein
MNISIKYPAVKALQEMGLYYIFTTQKTAEYFHYQTLPNTNLCLSVYQSNRITRNLSQRENSCLIQPGGRVHSRLWGFHKKPFDVLVQGEMDQVSIIFQAGGLRRFTRIPYAELMQETDVLGMLFGISGNDLAEQLFSTGRMADRVNVLDQFLLNVLHNNNRQEPIDRFLLHLDRQNPQSSVLSFAATENKDTSTLYRHFKQYVGQGPKEYLKVVRFRKALRALQQKSYRSLTDLAHSLGYYDQSHFIKDFTLFADYNPGLIHKITTVVEEELILIPRS